MKASAVRAAASLSGQLTRTCEIRPQHILTLRGPFPPLPSPTAPAALWSAAPLSSVLLDIYLPADISMQKLHTSMDTEHYWDILVWEEFFLVPPRDSHLIWILYLKRVKKKRRKEARGGRSRQPGWICLSFDTLEALHKHFMVSEVKMLTGVTLAPLQPIDAGGR